MSVEFHQLVLFGLAFAMMMASPGPLVAAKARKFLSDATAIQRANRATGGVMVGAGVTIAIT